MARGLVWSAILESEEQSGTSLPLLSRSVPVQGDPDVDHQIGDAEDPLIGDFYKRLYMDAFRQARIEPSDARILELGAGFGKLAFGTFNNFQPETYVATDVFPTLVETLASNLPRWTSCTVGAALLDPQDDLLFRAGYFNVIQSHSVLHHVLDYKKAVRELFERLDAPGVLIFAEPCLEGYVFFITVIRMFRKLVELPEGVGRQLDAFDEFIVERCGSQRNDMNFLSRYGAGDKYIFSAIDLLDLANSIGAALHVQKEKRDVRAALRFELMLRGADARILEQFDQFLADTIPPHMTVSYQSNLSHVFYLIKRPAASMPAPS